MPWTTHQALICWAAAKTLDDLSKDGGVADSVVHMVANSMDDCISYSTHKYVSDPMKTAIHKFMETEPGAGIFGFWQFRDGSALFAICGNEKVATRYVLSFRVAEVRHLHDVSQWSGKGELPRGIKLDKLGALC